MDVDGGNRLGEYLRARRGLVSPEQAGLSSGSARRVPGLRREEVALLAGISADYYLRLERGRDTNPSVQVLQALVRVLGLDEVEAEYLIGMGRTQPARRTTRRTEGVPVRLQHLLTALQLPAFIESRWLDVLASNDAAVALSPRLVPGRNRLRSLLLDAEERAFHDDWDTAVIETIAAFRRSIGDDTDNPRAIELVGELSLSSARFRSLWARHDVKALRGGTARVHHPQVGPLRLHREKVPVDDLLLVIYYPEPGSADEERLHLLGALTAQTRSSADSAQS